MRGMREQGSKVLSITPNSLVLFQARALCSKYGTIFFNTGVKWAGFSANMTITAISAHFWVELVRNMKRFHRYSAENGPALGRGNIGPKRL